jgi:hypothetical protein
MDSEAVQPEDHRGSLGKVRPSLVVLDRAFPKRICVIGDPIVDVWVTGQPRACQDDCGCFVTGQEYLRPGGAAGAASQLGNWGCEVSLVAPLSRKLDRCFTTGVCTDLCFECPANPVKYRYVKPDGRIAYRVDKEPACHGLSASETATCREQALRLVREQDWHGLLISDYGKGFLDGPTVHGLVRACVSRGIRVVADLRLPPGCARGAVLKCNAEYAGHHPSIAWQCTVVTCGPMPPLVFLPGFEGTVSRPLPPDPSLRWPPVRQANHVGAGDCFAAHLLLGLSHGLSLADAALWAHAAGRVYVQKPYGEPPEPAAVEADLLSCLAAPPVPSE